MKKLNKSINLPEVVSFKDVGLPDREVIESVFYQTSNREVIEGLKNWFKTPDCSLTTIKELNKITSEIIKNYDSKT